MRYYFRSILATTTSRPWATDPLSSNPGPQSSSTQTGSCSWNPDRCSELICPEKLTPGTMWLSVSVITTFTMPIRSAEIRFSDWAKHLGLGLSQGKEGMISNGLVFKYWRNWWHVYSGGSNTEHIQISNGLKLFKLWMIQIFNAIQNLNDQQDGHHLMLVHFRTIPIPNFKTLSIQMCSVFEPPQ